MTEYYRLINQLGRVSVAHSVLSDCKIEKGSLLQKIFMQLSEELLSLSLQIDDLEIKGKT